MLGNENNPDYYLRMQEEYGFRYLPEDCVGIKTNGWVRPARICAPYNFDKNGETVYNGYFLDNGSSDGFINKEEKDICELPVQLTLLV